MNNKTYGHILVTPWASVGIFSLTTFLSVIHLINGGRVIVASTDILWFWEPLLEIFHDNFRNGELGYWNPLIAGGTGNYFNTYYTPFSPEFLLAALFSKKFVYHILTLTYIAHLFLIGVISHRILLREVPDAVWATTGAIVAQLSLPIAVALTSPAAIYNITYFLLAVYVVWSFEKRHPVLSLLYLTLAIVLCGLTGNLAIGSWAGVVFVVLAIYRILTMSLHEGGLSRRQYSVLTGSAIVAAFFITAIHWLPLAVSLPESVRLGNVLDFSKQPNSWPSIMRIVAPEWLGVNYFPSSDYFVSLGRDGRHIQFAAPVSYGVLTALIIAFGLVVKRTRPSLFWGVLAGILICIAARLDPIFPLYVLLFNPVIHPFGVEFFTPIVVGALVGHVGMNLFEAREGNYEWKSAGVLGVMILFIGYLVYSWTAIIHHVQRPPEIHLILEGARVGFSVLSVFLATLIYFLFFKKHTSLHKWSYGLLAFGLAVMISIVTILKLGKMVSPFYFESGTLVGFRILSYSAIPAIFLFVSRRTGNEEGRRVLWVALFLISCIALFSYGYQRPDGVLHPVVGTTGDFAIAGLNLIGLVVATLSCLVLLKMIGAGQVSSELSKLVLALFIAAELIVTFHVHDRMIVYPAHSPEQVDARSNFDLRTAGLRDQDGREVDAVNFRIGRPIDVVGMIKGGIWAGQPNQLETNATATLGMSTYSGVAHVIDKKIRDLYRAFGLELPVGGIPAHMEDPRFLDLLSVGYIFDSKSGKFVRRDSSIGRFQLYTTWRRVSSLEEALEILKSPDFDPQRELVIMGDQSALPAMKQEESKLVPIKSAGSDRIELEVDSSHPSLLLFNDNYSRWWRARVNGVSVEIIKANFSRMALPVPKGRSTIELELRPDFLNQAAVFMIIGLGVFLSVAGWLFRRTGSRQYEALVAEGGREQL